MSANQTSPVHNPLRSPHALLTLYFQQRKPVFLLLLILFIFWILSQIAQKTTIFHHSPHQKTLPLYKLNFPLPIFLSSKILQWLFTYISLFLQKTTFWDFLVWLSTPSHNSENALAMLSVHLTSLMPDTPFSYFLPSLLTLCAMTYFPRNRWSLKLSPPSFTTIRSFVWLRTDMCLYCH